MGRQDNLMNIVIKAMNIIKGTMNMIIFKPIICVCTYISEWVMMTNCWLIALLATFMFKQLLKCIPLSLPAHLSSWHIMTHHDSSWHVVTLTNEMPPILSITAHALSHSLSPKFNYHNDKAWRCVMRSQSDCTIFASSSP